MTLKDFFTANPKVAIAFSGGVDSAFLLYKAVQHAEKVTAYYVKSQFQPQFELDDAVRFAKEIGAELKIIKADVLSSAEICSNPANRCYYCKNLIFSTILQSAKADGYEIILDGTNASDDINDRPGFKALQELQVKSPLRECNLTKQQIRSLSLEAGLFTHDKPAYACLATRIKTGETITAEKLIKTEKAENYLFSLGFTDFRVRMAGDTAKIQVKLNDYSKALEKMEEIKTEFSKYYSHVILDEEVQR